MTEDKHMNSSSYFHSSINRDSPASLEDTLFEARKRLLEGFPQEASRKISDALRAQSKQFSDQREIEVSYLPSYYLLGECYLSRLIRASELRKS